jgi:hypothetical protein
VDELFLAPGHAAVGAGHEAEVGQDLGAAGGIEPAANAAEDLLDSLAAGVDEGGLAERVVDACGVLAGRPRLEGLAHGVGLGGVKVAVGAEGEGAVEDGEVEEEGAHGNVGGG